MVMMAINWPIIVHQRLGCPQAAQLRFIYSLQTTLVLISCRKCQLEIHGGFQNNGWLGAFTICGWPMLLNELVANAFKKMGGWRLLEYADGWGSQPGARAPGPPQGSGPSSPFHAFICNGFETSFSTRGKPLETQNWG